MGGRSLVLLRPACLIGAQLQDKRKLEEVAVPPCPNPWTGISPTYIQQFLTFKT